MGGDVMLQCIVDQMLFVPGEQNPVDLTPSPWFDQGDALINLGEPRAHGCHGPLDRSIPADAGSLMVKVPNILPPVLEMDVSQVRVSSLDDFQRTAVESRREGFGARGFVQDGRLGPFLERSTPPSDIEAWRWMGRSTTVFLGT
jgi:hypothetical protein